MRTVGVHMKTEELKRFILKMFRGNEFYGYDVNKRLSFEGVEVELTASIGS